VIGDVAGAIAGIEHTVSPGAHAGILGDTAARLCGVAV